MRRRIAAKGKVGLSFLGGGSARIGGAVAHKLSSFSYLNAPRLSKYAAMQGFEILYSGPPAGQSLNEVGFELNHLISACRATLEDISIIRMAERIQFADEGYVGQLVSFDRLRFRTKNLAERPVDSAKFQLTGELSKDTPHLSRLPVMGAGPEHQSPLDHDRYSLRALSPFRRPQPVHRICAHYRRRLGEWSHDCNLPRGCATHPRIRNLRRRDGFHNSDSGIFEVLEDGVSRSREIVWCGNLERCDFCGPLHIPRLAGALTIPVDAAKHIFVWDERALGSISFLHVEPRWGWNTKAAVPHAKDWFKKIIVRPVYPRNGRDRVCAATGA